MGPWILGFSYEIFWRDRKRLRESKSLFIIFLGEEEEKSKRAKEGKRDWGFV